MKASNMLLAAATLVTYSLPARAENIEDNSFLIEEAFNQDAGIVQFVQTYQREKAGDALYTLSVEIPASNVTHQISFNIPYTQAGKDTADIFGIGDVGLNYRYQLMANGTVNIAPRISLLLPSGDQDKTLGSGVVGLQTNWAFSVKVHPSWILHANVGATWLPNVKVGSTKSDLSGSNSALSAVWLLNDHFNLLVEFVHNTMEAGENDRKAITSDAVLNPGFRYALDFENSQLVLGASVPTPVLYSKNSASYLAYVSYEPKLW